MARPSAKPSPIPQSSKNPIPPRTKQVIKKGQTSRQTQAQPQPQPQPQPQAQPRLQTPQTHNSTFNYGTPVAPGSSVWPATMKMTKGQQGRKSTSGITKASTPQASVQPQKTAPKQHVRQEGVGTRSTTVIGDNELSPYQVLMKRKLQLRTQGMMDEANRIQAAVNVGMVLHWSEAEVVRTVEKLEVYAAGDVDGRGARKAKLTAKMMEVAGEEEVLGFVGSVEEQRRGTEKEGGGSGDFGFERLRSLRGEFSPEADMAGDAASDVTPGGISQHNQTKLFAPLLLIKIQAALNVAFRRAWNDQTTNDGTGISNSNAIRGFDIVLFKQAATHLLRVPNKQCSPEIFHLLRHSKLGRKRFGDVDSRGRTIVAMLGIEKQLDYREKARLIDRVKTELVDGRQLVKTVMQVLGRGEGSQNALNYSGWVEGGLGKRAMAELRDESFLVLDSMYRMRCGKAVLVPEYVVDGEEEEEVESGNESEGDRGGDAAERSGGLDGIGDRMLIDGEGKRGSLKVKLNVRPFA